MQMQTIANDLTDKSQDLTTINSKCAELWNVNPCGAILNTNSSLQKELIDEGFKLLGFSDGSFTFQNNDAVLAGIGGYLKDVNGSLKFLFSGPVRSLSSMQAELEAVSHLIKSIAASQFSSEKCLIHLDSEEVVSFILKIKAGLVVKTDLLEDELVNIFMRPNLKFKYIGREMNSGADDLAKQGRQRNYLLQGWC